MPDPELISEIPVVLAEEPGLGALLELELPGAGSVQMEARWLPGRRDDSLPVARLNVAANVKSMLGAADYAAIRAALSLVPGTNVQAYHANLAALAGLAGAADKLGYFSGAGALTLTDLTAVGRALIGAANVAAAQAGLSLTPGVNVQAYSGALATWAGLLSDLAAARAALGLGSIATQSAGAVAISGGAITGTTVDGVAIKSYVDNLLAGLKWKSTVVAATTVAGTLASSFEAGDTIDGVVLTAGDRILIKDQAAGAENGIYIVAASGPPTRATDADAGSELVSATVIVEQGTTNADKAFVCTNNAITLGVTAIVFVNYSATITGALLAVNNLSDLLDVGAARSNLGLIIGTHVQAYHANLAAIAGLTSAADKLAYFTGSGAAALADLTAYVRTLLAAANAAAARTTLELGSLATQGAGAVAVTGGTVSGTRVTPRVQSLASAATVTPNADADDVVVITAQAEALTLANPSGTPTEGQKLTIRIKDNLTARSITFGSQYRALGNTLPTITTLGKILYLGLIWNATDSKWDLVAKTEQA